MMNRSQSAFPIAPTPVGTAPKLRQPVSLEVPVRLQGQPNGHDTFFEDTQTVLVFNEGAVLRVGAEVQPGQALLLTNRSTRQQAACRVAYVKQHGNVRGYAEVEFSAPAPGFWDGLPSARVESRPETISPLPMDRHAIPAAPAPTMRVAESFVPVDNIADPIVTGFTRALPQAVVLPETEPAAPAHAGVASVVESPRAVPVVDEIEQMLAQRQVESDHCTQESARAAQAFAAKLLDPAGQVAFACSPKTNRKRWVAGVAAAVALLTIGTSLGSWGLQAEVARIVPPPPAMPEPPAWAVASLFAPSPTLAELPLRTPHNHGLLIVTAPFSVRHAADVRRSLAKAATATPTLTRPAVVADFAVPEIPSSPAASALMELLPTVPASVAAPVAPAESKLEPLRLISSLRPNYPALARQARTQGEVLIHAHVDETGKVAQMRILSGPPSLRQAALDALSQWKYAPAKLNGKPVAMDTVVSIKFQL